MYNLIGRHFTTFTDNHSFYIVADYSHMKQEVTLEVYEFIGSVPKHYHNLTWLAAFVKPHEVVVIDAERFGNEFDEMKERVE